MEQLTTQLIIATALTEDNGLQKSKSYIFSLQSSKEGYIRIVTTDDIEVLYSSIHDFLIAWSRITSIGWANDKETFAKMLEDLNDLKANSGQPT